MAGVGLTAAPLETNGLDGLGDFFFEAAVFLAAFFAGWVPPCLADGLFLMRSSNSSSLI